MVVAFAKTINTRVNVYHTTGTVGTCVDHPTQGKTSLFRRDQTVEDLRRIFANPRVHTGVGYHRREERLHRASPRHAAATGRGRVPPDDDVRRWTAVLTQLGFDETEVVSVMQRVCFTMLGLGGCSLRRVLAKWVENYYPRGSAICSIDAAGVDSSWSATTAPTPSCADCRRGTHLIGGLNPLMALLDDHDVVRREFILWFVGGWAAAPLHAAVVDEDGDEFKHDDMFKDAHVAYGERAYGASSDPDGEQRGPCRLRGWRDVTERLDFYYDGGVRGAAY